MKIKALMPLQEPLFSRCALCSCKRFLGMRFPAATPNDGGGGSLPPPLNCGRPRSDPNCRYLRPGRGFLQRRRPQSPPPTVKLQPCQCARIAPGHALSLRSVSPCRQAEASQKLGMAQTKPPPQRTQTAEQLGHRSKALPCVTDRSREVTRTSNLGSRSSSLQRPQALQCD